MSIGNKYAPWEKRGGRHDDFPEKSRIGKRGRNRCDTKCFCRVHWRKTLHFIARGKLNAANTTDGCIQEQT